MTELLRQASNALVANDCATLEQLAQAVAGHAASLGAVGQTALPPGFAPAAEVLRRQVLAASTQLATRRRLSPASSLQVHSWAR